VDYTELLIFVVMAFLAFRESGFYKLFFSILLGIFFHMRTHNKAIYIFFIPFFAFLTLWAFWQMINVFFQFFIYLLSSFPLFVNLWPNIYYSFHVMKSKQTSQGEMAIKHLKNKFLRKSGKTFPFELLVFTLL